LTAPKDEPFDVRTLSVTYSDGFHVGRHRHEWAQLIYARSGLMRVKSGGCVWLVPPTRAIWIPAGTDHEFRAKGIVAFRTVYVSPSREALVERSIGAFEVSPLLAELILHILTLNILDPNIPKHDRLAGVLVDLINGALPIDLMLPLPSDPRAIRLAEQFQERPEDSSDLPSLARLVGASVRTLQRCFVAETGLTIAAWRQKARLVASTVLLARGSNVTNAAFDCGYESPSAFIEAFKRQFGMTPRQFAAMR